VDAYQNDIFSLEELRSRRQTITSELRQIEHEWQRLAHSQLRTHPVIFIACVRQIQTINDQWQNVSQIEPPGITV
jgi:hypothetical protein